MVREGLLKSSSLMMPFSAGVGVPEVSLEGQQVPESGGGASEGDAAVALSTCDAIL